MIQSPIHPPTSPVDETSTPKLFGANSVFCWIAAIGLFLFLCHKQLTSSYKFPVQMKENIIVPWSSIERMNGKAALNLSWDWRFLSDLNNTTPVKLSTSIIVANNSQ